MIHSSFKMYVCAGCQEETNMVFVYHHPTLNTELWLCDLCLVQTEDGD